MEAGHRAHSAGAQFKGNVFPLHRGATRRRPGLASRTAVNKLSQNSLSEGIAVRVDGTKDLIERGCRTRRPPTDWRVQRFGNTPEDSEPFAEFSTPLLSWELVCEVFILWGELLGVE